MFEDKYFYERRFEILINDAFRFAKKASEAFEKEDFDELELFSRSSVFITTLLLECAANCCLHTIDLSNKFGEDIDKLPFLSKYEFYLMNVDKTKKIDRGCQEFQNASELKSIRDMIVHPKVKRAKWERIDDNRSQIDFGQTNLLKIPYSIEEWNLTDIQTSLRVACAFLDYFFRVVCLLTPNQVVDLLLSMETYSPNKKHIEEYSLPNSWKDAQNKWALRLQFLGIESFFENFEVEDPLKVSCST